MCFAVCFLKNWHSLPQNLGKCHIFTHFILGIFLAFTKKLQFCPVPLRNVRVAREGLASNSLYAIRRAALQWKGIIFSNMERTIPYSASEEVELYLRTFYSLLRTTADVQIRTLESVHASMHSSLHPGAQDEAPDMSAFIYSTLRLPSNIEQVERVVLGQSCDVFYRAGEGDIVTWELVSSQARRRRCYFDGKNTLACIIASRTDIDDIVPLLTAYQIEREKLHNLLNRLPPSVSIEHATEDYKCRRTLAEALLMDPEDLTRLQAIWGAAFIPNLKKIASRRHRLRVQLLNGSLTEYRRATHAWWAHIEETCPEVLERPIYFVSSNTHSLINLLSGFALQNRGPLLDYLNESGDDGLQQEWQDIQAENVPSSQENFFYYLLKKCIQTPEGRQIKRDRTVHERDCGIIRIDSKSFFDLDAQVVDISRLKWEWMDQRLCGVDFSFLERSDALILNTDYPLGLAAYNLLTEISEHVRQILGVYIMGKAATLNGVIGDVMIPNVVHDEQTRNTYLFPNAFTAADVTPYLVYGTGLDNQKAVSVVGTFLQTARYMDVFYREGFTDIEMEAGSYLSAIYEMSRPKRHPVNEIVHLANLPFDLGIMHYASDTPLSKGKNLGAGTLSYFGMDPTYATSIAILRRILQLERRRLLQSD